MIDHRSAIRKWPSRAIRLVRLSLDFVTRPTSMPEVVFVGAFIAAFLLSSAPFVTPDSGGYERAGESVAAPWTPSGQTSTWGAVSFLGNGFRSWPPTLFYALVPGGNAPLGEWGRILLQGILVVVATVCFARALAHFVPSRYAWMLRTFVYLCALTPSALTYNLTIGAEGLTYIFVLFSIATTLTIARRHEAMPLGRLAVWACAAYALAVLALVTRASFVPMLVVIVVSLAFIISHRTRAGTRLRLAIGAGALAVIALTLGYSTIIQANQSAAWGSAEAGATGERAYRMFLALDVGASPDFAETIRASLPTDAPTCLRDYPRTPLDWSGMSSWGARECGVAGLTWIEGNYFQTIARAYVLHPRKALRYFVETGGNAGVVAGIDATAAVRSPSPALLDVLVNDNPLVDRRNVALFGLLITLAAGIVILRRFAGRERGKELLRSRSESATLLALAVGAWAAFYLSFFDFPGAADRKAWPFLITSILLATAVAVSAACRRRTGAPRCD